MKHKKIKWCVLLLCIGLTAQTQQATTAAGGDASGSGGTVAYSVGQVVYTTNTDAFGTLSQGVQQAYEIFTYGFTETELNISLSVFPNPAADHLTLQVKDYSNEKLSYQIYDMQGKLIRAKAITSNQTQVDMRNLPSATYYFHIVQENKKVQSFKIMKK